jgi:hypothetical protein
MHLVFREWPTPCSLVENNHNEIKTICSVTAINRILVSYFPLENIKKKDEIATIAHVPAALKSSNVK